MEGFSVSDRLVLLSVLPKQGNAVTLRILRDFEKELSFTEDEIAEFKLKQSGDTTTWDEATAKAKNIDLGDTMSEIIVASLKQMDASKTLTTEHMPLYDRFVSSGES
jgi:hypothetical protein